jgi:hypothetical protein
MAADKKAPEKKAAKAPTLRKAKKE